jgi:hypothetical protein
MSVLGGRSFQRLTMVACAVLVGGSTALGTTAEPTEAAAPSFGSSHLTASTNSVYRAAASVSGPVTVGHVIEPLSGVAINLSKYGYEENEYFASGTAHAFRATSAPNNGRWTIVPTTSASYRTRIIVRRPSDPSHFSGTVIVEWMNESAGESAPEWDFFNPELMAAGDAYVGVSAQALGVNGGTPLLGSVQGSGKGLVQQEPARYGTLHHPGDQYALDMFSQIGQALRRSGDPALGPLRPKHVVAAGESQSAFYLTTFADAIQPVTHSFDGIFIHSRGGSGASLNGSSISGSISSGSLRIRTDTTVPVFMFETQTDLIQLGFAPAQQPNTKRIRTWEVAGTSHADSYLLGAGAGFLGCTTVNTGPQHVVVQAALASFLRWVVHGTPPPTPAPFRLRSLHPPALALDRYGNVIGGVRTPAVDVPVATLSGAPAPGASAICGLFGSTTPFSAQMLTDLYGTESHYLARYTAALDRAIRGGYLLATQRSMLLAQAHQVHISAS